MKYIKTYWHGLLNCYNKNYYHRIRREPLYQFVLSSLLLLKHHTLILYTDKEGADHLACLNIPFFEIHIVEIKSHYYKAINDLYVLSLQTGPAIIFEDSLLVMGKLFLNTNQSSIIALVIESNKSEFIKAIFSLKRLSKFSHWDDDSFIESQDSFIDTSLLYVKAGRKIKKYFESAILLVEENKEDLANIDQVVVENILRRIYLNVFLKSNGIVINTYFKEPINSSTARDSGFGFSNLNIKQNIIRLGDLHLNDDLFCMHYLQYFKYYHQEFFNQVSKLDTNTTIRKVAPFIRTEIFLEKQSIKDANIKEKFYSRRNRSIVNEVKNFKKNSDRILEYKILHEIYNYESYLKEINRQYRQKSNTINLNSKESFIKLIKYWNFLSYEFEEVKLKRNPFIYFRESGWKWATRWIYGISNKTLADLKIIYNLSTKESYFITAFLPNPMTNATFEFDIDKLSADILDYFGEWHTVKEYFSFIRKKKSKESLSSIQSDQNYLYQIRELLLVNLLCFVND